MPVSWRRTVVSDYVIEWDFKIYLRIKKPLVNSSGFNENRTFYFFSSVFSSGFSLFSVSSFTSVFSAFFVVFFAVVFFVVLFFAVVFVSFFTVVLFFVVVFFFLGVSSFVSATVFSSSTSMVAVLAGNLFFEDFRGLLTP